MTTQAVWSRQEDLSTCRIEVASEIGAAMMGRSNDAFV